MMITGSKAVRAAVCAASAVVLLAACGQSGEEKAAGGEAASAGQAPSAAMAEGPTPGLWRVSTQISGMPEGMAPPTTELCFRDSKFQTPTPPPASSGMSCEEMTFRRDGDAMVGRSVCTMGETDRTETNVRITGDYTRRFTMEAKVTQTPAPRPEMAETTMTATYERIGDCPAE